MEYSVDWHVQTQSARFEISFAALTQIILKQRLQYWKSMYSYSVESGNFEQVTSNSDYWLIGNRLPLYSAQFFSVRDFSNASWQDNDNVRDIVCTKSLNIDIVSNGNYDKKYGKYDFYVFFSSEISQEKINGRTADWL
jgi:hypothetical protein